VYAYQPPDSAIETGKQADDPLKSSRAAAAGSDLLNGPDRPAGPEKFPLSVAADSC